MCISEFRGLFDLGVLIGTGILLCAVAIVFLVPAMIKWNEGVRKRKVESVKKLHVQSFLLEYLIPLSVGASAGWSSSASCWRRRRAGWLATTLEFDDTVQVLRSNKSEAFKRAEEDGRPSSAPSLSYMMAIAEAPTSEEALELAEAIEQRLQPFLEDGTVHSYDTIFSATCRRAPQQREGPRQARRGRPRGAFDAERVEATFLAALDDNGFNPRAFEQFLGRHGTLPERPQGVIGRLDLLDEQRGSGPARSSATSTATTTSVRIVTYMSMADQRWKPRGPAGAGRGPDRGRCRNRGHRYQRGRHRAAPDLLPSRPRARC